MPELAPDTAAQLRAQQRFPLPAQMVAQPEPDEMKDLMDQDAVQLAEVTEQTLFEIDATATQKRSGMDFHAGRL